MDKVFDFTFEAIEFVLGAALFVCVWLIATFFLYVFMALAGAESFLLAAVLGAALAAFAMWFLLKLMEVSVSGIVALFGNEPAREAVVAQYQGTRNPAEVIVEDEIEQSDGLEVRLQRLANLRDRGLITPEDYETQKRRLLEEV